MILFRFLLYVWLINVPDTITLKVMSPNYLHQKDVGLSLLFSPKLLYSVITILDTELIFLFTSGFVLVLRVKLPFLLSAHRLEVKSSNVLSNYRVHLFNRMNIFPKGKTGHGEGLTRGPCSWELARATHLSPACPSREALTQALSAPCTLKPCLPPC